MALRFQRCVGVFSQARSTLLPHRLVPALAPVKSRSSLWASRSAIQADAAQPTITVHHISSSSSSTVLSALRRPILRSVSRLLNQRSRAFSSSTASASAPTASVTAVEVQEMKPDKAVSTWLFICCGVVFAIVVLGGATRLTRSGLSMTSWKFTGEKPPGNDDEWAAEFEKYKQHPEYKRVNVGMQLEEFKFIYWMEWSHRMAGRTAGMVFGLPFLYFLARGRIKGQLLKRLSLLFGLGGLQGLIGWWMVRSGLKEELLVHDQPRVSPYRLTVHLSSAFLIYMILMDTAMKMWPSASSAAVVEAGRKLPLLARSAVPARFRGLAMGALHVAATTVVSGALVAGNQAGFIYNEWPTMGDGFIPSDIISSEITPFWKQFFEHGTLVQFDHRILAYSTLGWVTYLWASSRKLALPRNTRLAVNTLFGLVYFQATLGISTLLLLVPVPLGVLHQAGSLTVLTSALWLLHTTRKVATSARSPMVMPFRMVGVAVLAAVASGTAKSMYAQMTEVEEESSKSITHQQVPVITDGSEQTATGVVTGAK